MLTHATCTHFFTEKICTVTVWYVLLTDAEQFGAGKYLLRLKTQTTTMIRHIGILQ